MLFKKYHGLGNDYLVANPREFEEKELGDVAARICARHYGIGADGLLVGPWPSRTADFRLRIFNPDGSEAEKSGNGLRIFCRFLYDDELVAENEYFSVDTLGGIVRCRVKDNGSVVQVEMGHVSFWSDAIAMNGVRREVINEQLSLPDRTMTICAASVGNPHCIVLDSEFTEAEVRLIGPQIENHPMFLHRTNVQFLTVLDRRNIRLMIWERGAGYTTASGSSSVAAAAVAHRLNLCDSVITVHMPGGALEIEFNGDFNAVMTGPVEYVCSATMN